MPKPWEIPHMPKLNTDPRQARKLKKWADMHLPDSERFKDGVDRLRDYLDAKAKPTI